MKCFMMCLLLLLVACSTAAQSLLWEDQFNLAGQADYGRGIAISGDKAVVLGQGVTATGVDMVVRAYAIQTGQLAWSDQVELAGIVANVAITQADGRVFSAGYAPDSVGTDFLTVAHDVATGNRLWMATTNKGRDDLPQDVAAGPAAVYVVGHGGDGQLDALVEAYDKVTGTLLWEDRVDNGGDDSAWRVTVADGLVFVALSYRLQPIDPWGMIIRAYNETTGTLVWQSVHPLALPLALAVNNGKLYVAGQGVLSAYQTDGVPLWSKSVSDTIGDIALVGQRIITVGANLTAYDASGNVVWGVPSDGGKAISVRNDVLYLLGTTATPEDSDVPSAELVARAYNAGNGLLLWQDTSHLSGETVASDIVAAEHGVVAVGWTIGSLGDTDLLVRAYSVPKVNNGRGKIRRFMTGRLWNPRP